MCILVHEILVIGMGKIMEKKRKRKKEIVCVFNPHLQTGLIPNEN